MERLGRLLAVVGVGLLAVVAVGAGTGVALGNGVALSQSDAGTDEPGETDVEGWMAELTDLLREVDEFIEGVIHWLESLLESLL